MERRNQSAISNQPGDFFLPPYTIGPELSAKYREVVYQEMPQDTAERRQVLRAISPKKIAYWERVGYSDDIAAFVSEALSPAKVVGVEIVSEAEKSCRATVPDHQLSLAIGNKGQNARLAAKLTGWKIDIRPESGYYGEDEE